MDVTCRPVGPGDQTFLLELFGSTCCLPDRTWGEGARAALLQFHFDEHQERMQAQHPGAERCILMHGEQRVGQLWVWRSRDQIRLMDLTVVKRYRGRGVGSSRVQGLLAEGRRTKRRVTLSVARNQERLVRWCIRLGFSVVDDNGELVVMEAWPV